MARPPNIPKEHLYFTMDAIAAVYGPDGVTPTRIRAAAGDDAGSNARLQKVIEEYGNDRKRAAAQQDVEESEVDSYLQVAARIGIERVAATLYERVVEVVVEDRKELAAKAAACQHDLDEERARTEVLEARLEAVAAALACVEGGSEEPWPDTPEAGRIQALADERASALDTVVALRGELEERDRAEAAHHKEMQGLQEELAAAKTRTQEERAARERAEASHQHSESARSDLEAKLAQESQQAQQALEALREEHRAEISALRTEHERRETALIEERDRVRERVDVVAEERTAQAHRAETAERDATHVKASLEEARERIAKLEQALGEERDASAKVRAELSDFYRDYRALSEKHTALADRFAQLSDEDADS